MIPNFVSYVTAQFILLLFLNQHILSTTGEKDIFQKTEFLEQNENDPINLNINNNYSKNKSSLKIGINHGDNTHFKKSDWFLNIPFLPIIVATSNSIPEGSCKRQLDFYLNHLKNGTLWATKMFDASAKYPYGIFNGLNRYLGSFDQCINIQTIVLSENEKLEEIRSKYCLVDIKYQEKNEPKNFAEKYSFWFDPQDSAWEPIRQRGDFRRYERNNLQMALCFPAKCQNEDIIAALKEPLEKLNNQYNLQIEATIDSQYCYANHEAPKFSNYSIAYCSILISIIALVIISTFLDLKSAENKELNFFRELLACFSASRSLSSIFKVQYVHRGFDTLHLIRCILTVYVVIAHRNLEYIIIGNISGSQFEQFLSKPFLGIMYITDVSVDGFLGFSGILMSFYLLGFLENSKGLQILPLIVKRFIRLAPSYLFVALAYALLIPHLGSGPFWESRLGSARDYCSSNWWINLFFMHNYVREKNMCLAQTWYLAVEFQSFVIGILLIGAFHKMSRKIGYTFLGFTFIISGIIPFYVTYKNDIDPFIKFNLRIKEVETSDYLVNYYIKTHLRLSPYLVGVIMGAFMYDYKFANWRLSKFWSQLLFLLQGILLPIVSQNFGLYFINPNLKPSIFMKALYASLHRPIFAFGLCSIPLLLTIGQGLDSYQKLLTPKWIQPFSKISYGIFLTHLIIQSYEFGTARTVATFSIYNKAKHFIGDIFLVTSLAFLLVILIEIPFTKLANLLLMGKKPTKPITSSNEEKKVD